MTSALLTAKQQQDLNGAIAEYLAACGFEASAAAFADESGVAAPPGAASPCAIERKWLAVARLQLKVLDLERKVSELDEALRAAQMGLPAQPLHGAEEGEEEDDGAGDDDGDVIPRTPERLALAGHRAAITAVRFHPVYQCVASASEDATVRLWDTETGALERTLRGHTNTVTSVDFSPSGALIATCSTDLTIKLWEFKGQEACKRTLHGHDHTISCVRFTPSGDHLISASRDCTIRIWEVATGYCARTLTGHEEWVRVLDVSPCGSLLASGGQDKTVRVWRLSGASAECVAVLRGHENVVECVTFAPRPATAEEVLKERSPGDEDDPLNLYVVISGSRDKTIRVWDPATSQCISVLEGHDNWVRDLAVAPNGRHLVSASDDQSLVVWRLSSGVAEHTLRAVHKGFITALAASPTLPHLYASGGADNIVRVWPTGF